MNSFTFWRLLLFVLHCIVKEKNCAFKIIVILVPWPFWCKHLVVQSAWLRDGRARFYTRGNDSSVSCASTVVSTCQMLRFFICTFYKRSNTGSRRAKNTECKKDSMGLHWIQVSQKLGRAATFILNSLLWFGNKQKKVLTDTKGSINARTYLHCKAVPAAYKQGQW